MAEVPDWIENRFWLEESWIEGLPYDVWIPRMSMPELIEGSCEEYPERTAINFYGYELTYSELKDYIDRFSTGLVDLGVDKGKTVALFMPNCPQFAIAYFGAMKITTVTAVNPLNAPRELKYQVEDSESDVLVTVENLYDTAAEVKDELDVEKIIVANMAGEEPDVEKGDKVVHWDDVMAEEPDPPEVEIEPDDLAVLQYTGGTTGKPKGCMLTHRNIVANTIQDLAYDQLQRFREKIDIGKRIAMLPWYHIYGQTVDLCQSLFSGGEMIVFADFDPEAIMEAIEEHKPDTFMGAPTMFVELVNHPKFEDYDLSSLVYVNNGAAPISENTVRMWHEAESTDSEIVEGYGLSECSPVTNTTGVNRERKVGSIGPPYPNTYEGVIDPESEEFLAIGEEGELVISGPQVMKGYWNKPEKTEESFFEAGGRRWFKTGDAAKFDEDGYVWIVDRLKDMILYKGHSVFPNQVEEVMMEHEAIKEVAVYGTPDEVAGEMINAAIVLEDEFKGKIDEQEVIDWCKKNMGHHKYPREVDFKEDLPKSAAGKYLKRKLRDEKIEESED